MASGDPNWGSTDEPVNSNGKSGGLGVALIVLVVVGGAFRVYRQIERDRPRREQERVREARVQEQATQQANEAMAGLKAQQESAQGVEAMQSEFKLTDRQMGAIFQRLWKEDHPDDRGGPWQIQVGNVGPENWWKFREWDVERVRVACQAAAGSGWDDMPPAGGP
jgi:hypothetical protein